MAPLISAGCYQHPINASFASTTGMPYLSAIAMISSILYGIPYSATGTIAFGYLPIFSLRSMIAFSSNRFIESSLNHPSQSKVKQFQLPVIYFFLLSLALPFWRFYWLIVLKCSINRPNFIPGDSFVSFSIQLSLYFQLAFH